MEKKTNKINVLQVCVGGSEFGGVETFLYEYYKYLDKNSFHWDFLTCSVNSFSSRMNSPLLQDSTIYSLKTIHSDLAKNNISHYINLYRKLKTFFEKKHYDIVHVNTGSIIVQAICAKAAKKRGNIVLITHSHSAPAIGSKKKEFAYDFLRKVIVRNSNCFLACSLAAGKWLYGNDVNFTIIKNAIEYDRFLYSEEVRDNVREQYKVSRNIVYEFVGRLDNNKNPHFVLDVFTEIVKQQHNAKLWIIGDGELHEEIENRIKSSNIGNSVFMFGSRQDIPLLMQAADALIFPSKHEGLSLVLIEAQAAGLPIFASDSITREHDISGLVRFLSLKRGAVNWAKIICETDLGIPRTEVREAFISSGYDIRNASRKLEKLYFGLLK